MTSYKAIRSKPIRILVIATQHGDERSAAAATLGLISNLCHFHSPANTALYSEADIDIIPILNPDGYAKNSRFNARGVDLNRSYPTEKNGKIKGLEAKILAKQLTLGQYDGVLAVHSGSKAVLWPYGRSDTKTPLDTILQKTAANVGKSMGISKVLRSYHDYPTQGELIDYVFDRTTAIALTIEISPYKNRSQSTTDLTRILTAGLSSFIISLKKHKKAYQQLRRTLTPSIQSSI